MNGLLIFTISINALSILIALFTMNNHLAAIARALEQLVTVLAK